MMGESRLLYHTEGRIGTIAINRPEARNAFSPEMITLWGKALEDAKEDEEVAGGCPHREMKENLTIVPRFMIDRET